MHPSDRDLIKPLLSEWRVEAQAVPGLSARVLDEARDGSRGARGLGLFFEERRRQLRFALACLAFGTLSGVALAEWVTLRNEDLYQSTMSNSYLQSIDPTLPPATGSGSS